jgi:hypothetical protein
MGVEPPRKRAVKSRRWLWIPLLVAVVLFAAAVAGVAAYVTSGGSSTSTTATQRTLPRTDAVLHRLRAECIHAGGEAVNVSRPFLLDGSAAGTAACTFDNSDGSFSRPGVAYRPLPCSGPVTFDVLVDSNTMQWTEPLPVRHAPLPEHPSAVLVLRAPYKVARAALCLTGANPNPRADSIAHFIRMADAPTLRAALAALPFVARGLQHPGDWYDEAEAAAVLAVAAAERERTDGE